MGFTTLTFLFVFFPLALLLYYGVYFLERAGAPGRWVKRLRLRDWVLIALSLGFYMWSGVDTGLGLCLYILAVYALGRLLALVQKKQLRAVGRLLAVLAVSLVLGLLVYVKYTGLLLELLGGLFSLQPASFTLLASLGISFITFSAISYLVDIYRGKARPGSLTDCALYLSFFPKVVSGPIVLFRDFIPQAADLRPGLEDVYTGLNRIMVGFAKKVLLADQFGAAITTIGANGIDQGCYLLTLLLYMLQIYYDFAGYSDMAIGMGRLFGFRFDENFRFPYRATSISEFWRRWHISLGTWFREYVYFPLGGSRRGRLRALLNLAVVFALTGIWHGAGYNYILWGAINGACVLVERLVGQTRLYRLIPKAVKYVATMAVTMLCWQLFRFATVDEAVEWVRRALGIVPLGWVGFTLPYYLDARLITQLVAGILGATVLGSPRVQALYGRLAQKPWVAAVQQLVLLTLFALSILFMVNSTYSPFLYFQY